MNNVCITLTEPLAIELGDVTGDGFRDSKTAFIGKKGSDEATLLFLVTWQGISEAANPKSTYSSKGVTFLVHKWVDINISTV